MHTLNRAFPAFPLFLLAAALLLGSCRPPHVELSTEHKDAIATVTVRNDIGLPEGAFYTGPASSLGALFGGIIGALIAEGAVEAEDLITQLVETGEVDLKAIVREEINQPFVESNPVGTVVDADGDAEFQFNVSAYGLHKHGWGFLDVGPYVVVHAKLVKRDGSVAWEKTENLGVTDDRPVQSFDEWMNDLDALREGFRHVTKIAVAYLVEDLKKAR